MRRSASTGSIRRATPSRSRAKSQPVLTAGFGATNPQGLFQYVRVEGRDALYLLPVFVGREWERVLAAMNAPGSGGRADARSR